MNKKVKEIDTKVKEQLKMLKDHIIKRDSIMQAKLDKENARPKPRKGDLAHINKMWDESRATTTLSEKLMHYKNNYNHLSSLDHLLNFVACYGHKKKNPKPHRGNPSKIQDYYYVYQNS